MKVNGCIYLYFDRSWKNRELHNFNMYKECETDLRFRMEEWDYDSFFACYFDMFDYIVQQENLGEQDENYAYARTDELCAYIVSKWKEKLPVIDWVDWGEVNPDYARTDVFMDVTYEVDCDYEVMYQQMKGESK